MRARRPTEADDRSRETLAVGAAGLLAVVVLVLWMLGSPVADRGGDGDGPPDFAPVPAEGGIPLDAPIPDGAAVARQEQFAPGELEVEEGVVLVFRNEDDDVHSFTADDGLFDSGILGPGGQFTFAFDGPARVPFHCEIHPSMRGTVVVTAADPG